MSNSTPDPLNPPDPLKGRSLFLPKNYKLNMGVADINVIQNSLRKMIEANRAVLQDKGIIPQVRMMRQANIDAATTTRDRIAFQVDQLDAAAMQKAEDNQKKL